MSNIETDKPCGAWVGATTYKCRQWWDQHYQSVEIKRWVCTIVSFDRRTQERLTLRRQRAIDSSEISRRATSLDCYVSGSFIRILIVIICPTDFVPYKTRWLLKNSNATLLLLISIVCSLNDTDILGTPAMEEEPKKDKHLIIAVGFSYNNINLKRVLITALHLNCIVCSCSLYSFSARLYWLQALLTMQPGFCTISDLAI